MFIALLATAQIFAQDGQRILTNADILNMAKSGLAEQTIILMMQKSTPKFDTSPEAAPTGRGYRDFHGSLSAGPTWFLAEDHTFPVTRRTRN
jgi:hypothetical protein